MELETTRRNFLSLAGKGLGLATLAVPSIGSLIKEVEAATKTVAGRFWSGHDRGDSGIYCRSGNLAVARVSF